MRFCLTESMTASTPVRALPNWSLDGFVLPRPQIGVFLDVCGLRGFGASFTAD
jgi:hypothetical protein